MKPYGSTRTRVQRNHALIAPDGHVKAGLHHWKATPGIILISPQMGARFVQYYALVAAGSESDGAAEGVQRFVYVMEGALQVKVGAKTKKLAVGDYAWLPPDVPHKLSADAPGKVLVFEKRYQLRNDHPIPDAVFGRSSKVGSVPFLGDPDATLQILLPDNPCFDMAINIFTYKAGAQLPFAETHIMEHGLLMLAGGGIYRLDESWYPVEAGDVIWMGPYCPQWFGALGKGPSAYIYYKDTYRDPLAENAE